MQGVPSNLLVVRLQSAVLGSAVLALFGVMLHGLLIPVLRVQAGTFDEIDYTRLVSFLGDATPNGAGVPISQVEAASAGAYFPATTDILFIATLDPFGQAVSFTPDSDGIGTTGHATTTVGGNFYGNPDADGQPNSLASGANEVTVYEATNWMEFVLNKHDGIDPLPQDFRVQNSSWISTTISNAYNSDILRRYDFVIDTNNITAVVGLNNGTGTLPQLLGHSYNAIAVGITKGNHSAGLTQSFYGPGRTKPDLVAPKGTTSAATAVVSSAATMLHEVVAGSDGVNSEVMKALLLAGATKGEFPDWSRTMAQPLDSKWGAGELNVYNSYLMVHSEDEGGPVGGQTEGSITEPDSVVRSHGWDFQTIAPGEERYYDFEIPDGSTAAELSIILAWNVEVTDSNAGDTFSGVLQPLANLDLTLCNSTVACDINTNIDMSKSTVDNVEHIYIGPGQGVDQLGPGTYTLKVSSDVSNLKDRDFGLAWRTNTLFDVVSADFDEDGDVDGSDFLAWQRGYGTLLGATHADGDADGDRDVDRDDLTHLQASFGPPPALPAIAAVPEPGALGLALLVTLALWGSRRSRSILSQANRRRLA
jgi:hypothetical protein